MKVFGPVEENARAQLERCQGAEEGSVAVLCADHHLGYSMPIGGVIAYEHLISPSAVGYDIGCGNMAVRTDVRASDLDVPRIMDDIWKQVSFGVGRYNNERLDHAVLDRIAASPLVQARQLAHLAAQQLGTVGSGNHYVDLFADMADDRLWVGVHFGSRGFGHKLATWALHEIGATDNSMDAPPAVISLQSSLGQDYLYAMTLAGEYAYAGREAVVARVLRIIGAHEIDRVHNHHNYAWKEVHPRGGVLGADPVTYWVHRKGATPAGPGVRGFVGGTMGEPAVILEGIEGPASVAGLYSTVHGAGRVLSRRKAKGKTRRVAKWRCQNYRRCNYAAPKGGYHKEPNGPTPKCPECGHKLRLDHMEEQLAPGLVDWAAARAAVQERGVELRGAGADEAPECYKRLSEVLAYHADTVKILHVLRPIGVAMAGDDVFDPYKD